MEEIIALEGPNKDKKPEITKCVKCGKEVLTNFDEPICMNCEDSDDWEKDK